MRRTARFPLAVALAATVLPAPRPLDGRECLAACASFASRRGAVSTSAAAAAAALLAGLPRPVAAGFLNELPEAARYEGRRNTGLRPGDIGLDVRKVTRKGETTAGPELKGCRGQEVNCFSTLVDRMVPGKKITWLLDPWRLPQGMTPADGIKELTEVVKAYLPGQGGMDLGGFRIVEVEPTYLYAQFAGVTALIDDVEFATREDGSVLVRSASRSTSDALGTVATSPDDGSNMKRLNHISAELRKRGWLSPEITRESHEYYFRVNNL